MKSPKFDEHDRKKVISEIEDHFGVHLSRLGSHRKYLEDEDGTTFWILGGYEDWHGISWEMLDEEEIRRSNGVLVVAKRYENRVDVFSGLLQPLIDNRGMLSHTQKGNYQFHINIRGNHLFLKEIPDLSLVKLGEVSYSGEEKESDKKIEAFKAIFSNLSPEQQRQVLEMLSNKQET
jgi:hypothetical protein